MSDYSPFRSGYKISDIKKSPVKDLKKQAQYREQYEKWPKEQKVADFPTHIDLELSSACNLHCPMCHTVYINDPSFTKFKEERMKDSLMDFDLFQSIINEATQSKYFFSIKLNYRGESTIHPQIVEMIDYARYKGVYDIMLNTNGNYELVLTEQMINAGLTWLSVSLDAIKPETYKRVRCGGDYYLAYANALNMCRFADRLHLQVTFVDQKINHKEKDDFVKFWKQMPVHKVTTGDFYNPGELIKNVTAFTAKKYVKSDKFTCPQLWQRIMVLNSGKLYPCCHVFEEPEDLYLGKFPDVSIKEAWNSEKLANIRKIHATGEYRKVDTCSRCAYPKSLVRE